MTSRAQTEHVLVRKLKLFAFFSLFQMSFLGLVRWTGDSAVDPISSGLIFSTVMTLLSGLVFGRANAGMAPGRAARARQSVIAEVPAAMATATERALAALQGSAVRNVLVETGMPTVILATIRRGVLRGERIRVSLTPLDAHRTRATVESRPRAPFAVVDDGESWTNVERLLVALETPDATLAPMT